MVHYDPTLTDNQCRASMAHHPLKDVEVHSLKRRKWRGEGGEKGWKKELLLSALLCYECQHKPKTCLVVCFGGDSVHVVGIPHYNVRIRPHHDGSLGAGGRPW